MIKGKSIFCTTLEGASTVVHLSFNTSTEHITISSGFHNFAKYRAENHEKRLINDREYSRTHRVEKALYRANHRKEISEYNQRYHAENQDKIKALSKTSNENPERKRRNYIRNRDRYHIELTGICSRCGLQKDTERHHLWYPDVFDPDAVIEVCKECHEEIEHENYMISISGQVLQEERNHD